MVAERNPYQEWIEYKKHKARAFIDRGYSVEWTADASNWMTITLPPKVNADEPEIRAVTKFYSDPSSYGINNGRISKLEISLIKPDVLRELITGQPPIKTDLYRYDRGLDIDRILTGTPSAKFFQDIIDELN